MTHLTGSCRLAHYALAFVTTFVAVMGAAYGADPTRPEPQSIERATPELMKKLRADPFDYFRFVNRSWITRACDAFAA